MKRIFHTTIGLMSVMGICFLLASCQLSTVNLNADLKDYNVNLYLKEYTPKFSGIHADYKGKKICLANIRNDARNTTNFSYYSKDIKVQYLLSNKANTHIQLIPSFFWYAYEKAFKHAGIEVQTRCEPGVPELWIIFRQFDDEELKFRIHLYENRETILEKEITITMPAPAQRDPVILQARAYDMIDLTIKTLLVDSSFQAALL